MISPSSIQEVMDRANVVEVVGEFVRLKKRGSNYIANCPFHNEKTPSFSVSSTKGIYKCFGCGKGGNVVTFIQDHEKLTYPEAIRWLADFYKIAIEETERTPEQQQQQKVEESLRILNEFAARYFQDTLLDTDEGQAIGLSYFKQRGFRKDILERFRLGYCPETGTDFYKAATAKGHSAELLEKAGLVKSRNGIPHDVYRGRVIFPIQSMTGRILGFGARILKSNEKAPKYINTPENELYIKSRVLYGLYQSRQAISKKDECFLVEGYTDVISLHQGGVENVVASSGTSLTEDQLRLIGQLTRNLTILYDGDAAGIKAAMRGLDMALSQGFNVQVVLLPEGEDPDSFIQQSGDRKFYEYVNTHKKDMIGFRLEVGLKDAGSDPVRKSKLVNEIAESISLFDKSQDFSLQSHYIREAATKLQVDEAGMVNLVNKYLRDRIEHQSRSNRKEQILPEPEAMPVQQEELPEIYPASYDEQQEWQLVKVLLELGDKEYEGHEDVAELLYERVDPDLFENKLARRVYELYFEYKSAYAHAPQLSYFINYPEELIQKRMAELLQVRYEMSENWKNKYNIETLHGDLNYINEVDSALVYFELKKMKDVEREVLKRIQTEKDATKLMIFQQKWIELKKAEQEIVRKHSTVILKMKENK